MAHGRLLGNLLRAPKMAKREGSVATTLLLLLVMGTAPGTVIGSWSSPVLLTSEVDAADVRPRGSASDRHAACLTSPGVERLSRPTRHRSVANRELPPARAPDLA